MTEIAPLSKGATTESPLPKVSVPTQSHLPTGKPVTSVQPHPTPLIAAWATDQPVKDENAKQQHVAQMRSEITGTGSLVDVIA
jgi:hypothetical protein